MKKLNTYLLALMGVLALSWSACTDSLDYDAAPNVSGEGVYFPSSVKTSFLLKATKGSFTLDAQRSKSVGAIETALTATFGESGGADVFTVPAKVNFAEGATESTVTVNYNNLVRGTTYKMTLTFTDGTPYGSSSLTFTVLYPAEVIEEWVSVSKNAALIDNMFSLFGAEAKDILISNIEVEKEKNSNKYRFRSPYNNAYFNALFNETVFPENFVAPYIVLDGETFKAEAPKAYYIPSTALGFKMTNGKGLEVNAEWNTFGSVAGNLKTSAGAIPPTSKDHPLGTYNAKVKMFNLGEVYHQIDNHGFALIKAGSFALYLDPKLMAPDFDRDYKWSNVADAAGYFTSEMTGKSWTQTVQQAAEAPTFYRFPDLYAKGTPIYFNYDKKKGTLSMPKLQPTGLTTFGNKVYVDLVPGKSSVDAETGKFTLTFSFYLVDKDNKKTAELKQTTETFLWGHGPLDQLVKGKKIGDYVGTWVVPMTNGEKSGTSPVTISKADETTLLVQGLSLLSDYDDTMALLYDAKTGYLEFEFQQVASIEGLNAYVVPFNSAEGTVGTKAGESLVGGLSKKGTLMFLNNPTNVGEYNSMVYVTEKNGSLSFMTGYWNGLTWAPAKAAASFNSLNSVNFKTGFKKAVKKEVTPKRIYQTELNIKASPVKHAAISTRIQTPAHNGLSLDVR